MCNGSGLCASEVSITDKSVKSWRLLLHPTRGAKYCGEHVCVSAHISQNHTPKLHKIFYTCYPGLWLGPPTTVKWIENQKTLSQYFNNWNTFNRKLRVWLVLCTSSFQRLKDGQNITCLLVSAKNIATTQLCVPSSAKLPAIMQAPQDRHSPNKHRLPVARWTEVGSSDQFLSVGATRIWIT